MFETPLIERFSRVHPAAPFLFWLPVLAYFIHRSVTIAGLQTSLALVPAGLLFWSLLEYVLHRWVFHWIRPTAFGRRFHFILHGVHHDFPQDGMRLVFPLGVSIPLGATVYLLFFAIFRGPSVDPFFVGFGAGYLAYDGIHYATHHFRMSSRLGKWLKRYHMVHHHTGENARWGVSTPLWDWVFGTMGQDRASAPRERAEAS